MATERKRDRASPRTLSAFIDKLMIEGVAAVFGEAEIPSEDPECGRLLVAWDGNARSELAGDGPPLSLATATWASRILYLGCKFVVCRDVSEAEIARSLAENCPEPRSPSVDWSADLVFRHLPEVYRGARHLSNADPLVRELLKLAAAWPLSSVGILIEAEPNLSTFIRHPALKQLYVDRILEAADVSRLGAQQVNEAIQVALGAYPELCPAVAAKLSPPNSVPIA